MEKFDKAYEAGMFDFILTTNLVYQTPELLQKPYYINCDLSKYIAYIIDTLNHDASISSLLNPLDRINKFWDNFDVAYFMKHSVRNIVWHAKVLLPHLDSSKSFVASRPLRGMEHAHEILILTQDRPELFARIVSNLQQYGLSIAEARIHTGRDGRVVDSFIVVDDGSDPNFEQEFARFQEILAEKLDLAEKLPPPLRGRPSRQSKLFPISPQASLRPDAAGKQYMLSIVTTDRLGLLASIARVFVKYGINLVTARITTLGERAEDVFLIESAKLRDPVFCAEFEKAVLEALEL